jgi:hypothetical protein
VGNPPGNLDGLVEILSGDHVKAAIIEEADLAAAVAKRFNGRVTTKSEGVAGAG